MNRLVRLTFGTGSGNRVNRIVRRRQISQVDNLENGAGARRIPAHRDRCLGYARIGLI